ncbi:WD40-repeat-containing domain protein [Chytridium lagenaria]|nr:WD40-repeat-containing domain protein [Chytridium lagenaria]
MGASTIQINWHDKNPVYTIDFEPFIHLNAEDNKLSASYRLATGGGDYNIRIWRVTPGGDFPKVVYLANLSRHSAGVNCVRWSPKGGVVASCGDDGCIIIWNQNAKPVASADELESWAANRVLRGSSSDAYDIAWSPSGTHILCGFVDNTTRIWDVSENKCVAVISNHSNFVQEKYFATQSNDRTLQIFKYSVDSTKKNPFSVAPLAKHWKLENTRPPKEKQAALSPTKSSHMDISNPGDLESLTEAAPTRLFHDESLNSFFRRLHFSPDGAFLVAPAGIARSSASKDRCDMLNTVHVFTRGSLASGPVYHLPGHKNPAIAVRFNPMRFKLSPLLPGEKHQFAIPYKLIFAVATRDSVVIYDTVSYQPIAYFGNFHYAPLMDVAWSPDGLFLIISSQDGFCSFMSFTKSELGECLTEPVIAAPEMIRLMKDDIPLIPTRTEISEDVLMQEAKPIQVSITESENSNDKENSSQPVESKPKKRRITPILVQS